MAYEIMWDDEDKTILRQIFSERVTMKDYYEANDEAIKLINQQAHNVDLILDLRTATIDMTGFLGAIRSVDKKIPTNLRLRVVVKANQFIRTMAGIAGKFTKRATEDLHFVDNIDEAYLLIKSHKRG